MLSACIGAGFAACHWLMVSGDAVAGLVGTRWRVGVVVARTHDPVYKLVVTQFTRLWKSVRAAAAAHGCCLCKSLYSRFPHHCSLDGFAITMHVSADFMDKQGCL